MKLRQKSHYYILDLISPSTNHSHNHSTSCMIMEEWLLNRESDRRIIHMSKWSDSQETTRCQNHLVLGGTVINWSRRWWFRFWDTQRVKKKNRLIHLSLKSFTARESALVLSLSILDLLLKSKWSYYHNFSSTAVF